LEALCQEFEARYERRYGAGSRSRQAAFKLVNARVDVLAPMPFSYQPAYKRPARRYRYPAPFGSRRVYWGPSSGLLDTPVFRGPQMRPGVSLEGPAVLELETTTVPVPPGQKVIMDGWLNLVVGSI